MARVRVSKEHAVLPPGYSLPVWLRPAMLVVSHSQPLRAYLFEGLPEGRFRTHVTVRYWWQVARWMERGNYRAVVRHVHPAAEVQIFSVGTYRGKTGWEEGLREWLDSFAELSLEPREYFRPGGGKEMLCIGEIRGTGAGSRVPVEREMAFLIRVEDGLAVYGRLFDTKAEALEAIGLASSANRFLG